MNAAARTALYHDTIETMTARIAEVTAWSPSARRSAVLVELQLELDEMLDAQASCFEIGADVAEATCEREAEEIEVSAMLNAAITTAQASGCALVKGAPTMLRELARLVPGCVTTRNGMEIAAVMMEGGELRVVRRGASYLAVVSFMAHRS